jgi:hypothetical protein
MRKAGSKSQTKKKTRTWRREKSKQQIHAVRLANLKKVIEAEPFKGNANACARAIGSSHTFLWQLLNEYRAMGEKTARRIEERLKLPERFLDESDDAHEKTRILRAYIAGAKLIFAMVPKRSLDALDKAPTEFRPSLKPREDYENLFFVQVTAEGLPLSVGDLAFVDSSAPALKLENSKLYVVEPKGWKSSQGTVLRAVERHGGRWQFVNWTEEDDEEDDERKARETFELNQVRAVVGRVIHVVKDC